MELLLSAGATISHPWVRTRPRVPVFTEQSLRNERRSHHVRTRGRVRTQRLSASGSLGIVARLASGTNLKGKGFQPNQKIA